MSLACDLRHIPVLVEPFLELGFPRAGRVFVDGTFGLGGHTRALLEKFPDIETCIGLDRDAEVLDLARQEWSDPRVTLVHERFSRLPEVLESLGIRGIDGLLLDVGVSSCQMDEAERGFSFTRSGPLDMRMDRSSRGSSAQNLLKSLSEAELEHLFSRFGEERFSRRIARAIVSSRAEGGLTTTGELAALIERAVPAPARAVSHIHPATRVFQALRIAVNDELEELKTALEAAIPLLNPDARLCVISFHSLEDRIAKTVMAAHHRGCVCPPTFPVCTCGRRPTLEPLTRKPIMASPEESASNPRSRSAKLRVSRKIPLTESES